MGGGRGGISSLHFWTKEAKKGSRYKQTFGIGWTCENGASVFQEFQQVYAVIIDAKRYGCLLGIGIRVSDVSTELKKILEFVHVTFDDGVKELFVYRTLNVALERWAVVEI